jgi:DNA-binding beta-propeller fold protein YncE
MVFNKLFFLLFVVFLSFGYCQLQPLNVSIINTFAGNSNFGFFGDGGLATNAQLYSPAGVTVDSKNNLVYIADYNNNRIRVVNRTTNIITTFAGNGNGGFSGDGGLATNAQLFRPSRVSVDSINNLVYIADDFNNRIRVVNQTTNIITTFAGNGNGGFSGDGGLATNAQLSDPFEVLVDSINNLVYITDRGNNRIRVVN